jgi:hypothetical protein
MTYLLFIIISGMVGIIGAILFIRNNNWRLGRLVLPVLAFIFFFAGLAEYYASFNTDVTAKSIWIRVSFIFQLAIAFLLLELIVSFLGKEGIRSPIKFRSKPIRLRLFWRPYSIFAAIVTVFSPWFVFTKNDFGINVTLNSIGEILFASLFCYHLLSLYIIEKLFRTITVVQKRIFTQFLVSAGFIAFGSMVVIVQILFYKIVSFEIIQLHAALCGVFFPGILIGLTRYRLWQEHIMIGRGIVYTSFTILFFGIFLIILGIIASSVRLVGIQFDEFDEFVLIFFVLFIGISVFFSPHMRKTITALSKKYIYKSKYDYRDQLFRLHNAHQASGNINQTINAFIDNLLYTIIVKKAYVFLRSTNENSFTLFGDTIGSAINKHYLRANSALISLFENNTITAININHQNAENITNALESEKELLNKLAISHLFTIKYQETLVGILGIDTGKYIFDSEDLMLISIFCESIGTALYRDRIQSEHIEQKQFESFNHMASFIVHDIKNQIATLSLVTKNAKANISNHEFHPILLRSLENCSVNLNVLIEKLKSPPHKEQLVNQPVDCNAIVKQIVDQTIDSLPEGIHVYTHFCSLPMVKVDENALSYIFKNLMVNAIEALGQQGIISCTTGLLPSFVNDDTYNFCLTPNDRENREIFIMIEDNGSGISRNFIENKLFRPFNTTKDKGIGLGLYQCKILIESMGGRLLCWSEQGKGTRFCILL